MSESEVLQEQIEGLTTLIQEISENLRFNINIMWVALGVVAAVAIIALAAYVQYSVKNGVQKGVEKALADINKMDDLRRQIDSKMDNSHISQLYVLPLLEGCQGSLCYCKIGNMCVVNGNIITSNDVEAQDISQLPEGFHPLNELRTSLLGKISQRTLCVRTDGRICLSEPPGTKISDQYSVEIMFITPE